MEKQQLVSDLNRVIGSSKLSVDLFFVFKTGEFYVQYLADPDSDLREKIIAEFQPVLKVYTAENNGYELNDIYDDNEYEDYHLFYDRIENNQIAQGIFNFDSSNALPYTKEVGALSKIYGFLIEISNGDDSVTIYKRNQPTNAVNPQNVINFFTGTDNKLQLIQQNAIYINKTIDLFKIGETVFINSRAVYEHQFGFEAELKAKATTGFIDLSATGGFDISDELQEKVKRFPKSELKKLSNLTRNNPIIENKNWKAVIRQGKRYGKHTFEINEDGTIVINTQKELKLLISILNRDFNVNDASKEKFLTKNKKLIN